MENTLTSVSPAIVPNFATVRHYLCILYVLAELEEHVQVHQEETLTDDIQPLTEALLDQVQDPLAAPTKSARPRAFPRPPHYKFKDMKGAAQFFRYWNKLPQECADRSVLYLYGNWPKLDPMQGLTPEELEKIRQKQMHPPPRYLDKLSEPFGGEDGSQWKEEMLHRYGSGSYHLKLNDIGVTGDARLTNKTVCTLDIEELNHTDFPPVRDWKLLDMAAPGNKSIIVDLRNRGIRLPGDELAALEQKEEDELAQVASIEKLTDAVVSMAKEQSKGQPQNGQTPQNIADSKAVETVAKGAAQGFEILGEAMKTAQQLQAKAADPLETIRALKEVASVLAPAPQANTGESAQLQMLMQMMKMQSDSNAAVLADMRTRLEAAEQRNTTMLERLLAKPDPSEKPKSLIGELRGLIELKSELREFLGGEPEDDRPWWGRTIENALDTLGPGILNFVQQVAAARQGPPPVDVTPEGQPQPAAAITPPAPQLSVEDQAIVNVLNQIKDPLLHCLANNTPGYDFAAGMIHQFKNEQVYNFISGKGKQGMFALMQRHPELWRETRQYATRLEVFADEFLDIERVKAALQAVQTQQQGRQILDPQTGKPVQSKGPKINKGKQPN